MGVQIALWEGAVSRGKCPPIVKVMLCRELCNKSSAVAEMGDRGHNRHGPKRGAGAVPLSQSAGNPSNTMLPAPRSTPYQVATSSIQPFANNSVGCHSPCRNISTNYYLIVEMHTVTVRSDDARYLLN